MNVTLQFSLYCFGLTSFLTSSLLAIFGPRNLFEYVRDIASGILHHDGTVFGFFKLGLRLIPTLYCVISLLIFMIAFIATWAAQIMEFGFLHGFFLGWFSGFWAGAIMMITWPFLIPVLI